MKVSCQTSNFRNVHTHIENADLDGGVLRVYKDAKQDIFDTNTVALLKNTDFHNGTIEVDLCSRLRPDAPDFARGFIGIVFRCKEDTSEFESFYVRPTNGRNCQDALRRRHGCQYFSFPGYTFAYFREFAIEGFEAPADIALDEWIHLKAEINGSQALFYVNGKMILKASSLKHGDSSGQIGFYVDTGTDGFFRNLQITCDD